MKRTAIVLGIALLCWASGSASDPILADGSDSGSARAAAASDAAPASGSSRSADAAASSTGEIVAERLGTRSLAEWYAMGGGAMHGLALCSVLILGLTLERSVVLRRATFVPTRLERAIREAIEVGQRQEIKRLCEQDASALARLSRLALEGADARERLESEGAAAAHRAHRNLPLLAALGNLATMIGLLGTVLGMVEAFEVIARSGTGDARLVAGGIFRALVTTAAGLGLGIFAVGAHAVLCRRATDLISALESVVTLVAVEVGRPSSTWRGDRVALELGSR